MYSAKQTASIVKLGSGGRFPFQNLITDQAEDDKIRVIGAGQESVLVFFPVDTNTESILTLRFTDDAGLHWQADSDLHLEHLESRDW
jgi:hypothetical protein